jgi:hypothetical protein
MGSPFASVLSNASPPQWGLFGQDGSPVLTWSSVKGIDYRHDFRISDYPQEQGAFESYNKTITPFLAKIVFLIGPPLSLRAAFLQQAEQVVASRDLVVVVTPEIQYPSANPTSLSYRRYVKDGITLLQVEIMCEEVRVLGSAQLSNTVSVNGAATQQNGIVQAGAPLTSQIASPANIQPQSTITTTSQAQASATYQGAGLKPPVTDAITITAPPDFHP